MVDFLITLFLGFFGVHRFMQKKYVTGLIWLFTFGLFGFGWLADVCIAFGNMVSGKEKEGDGENKGFGAEWKERAIRNRQETAVKAAYKTEEDKRKPRIKKMKHTRKLTPQEQQSIDMINTEIIKLWNDYSGKKIPFSDYIYRKGMFQTQINEIKNRAVWYESVELPPEIDPNVPIDVDEEAIRNSIKRLF